MKTVAEYIELIPDINVRTRVKELVNPNILSSTFYGSISEALDSKLVFDWNLTEEGFTYWYKVSTKYDNYNP